MKQNPLTDAALADYDQLVNRDQANLDLFWARRVARGRRSAPRPEVLAAEIVDDLEAALAQFAQISESLARPAEDA